jgi:hypothetical protein
MWQRSQVAIEGVSSMCFRITNLGSTFIEPEVWHKRDEIRVQKTIFNLRLTIMLTGFRNFGSGPEFSNQTARPFASK